MQPQTTLLVWGVIELLLHTGRYIKAEAFSNGKSKYQSHLPFRESQTIHTSLTRFASRIVSHRPFLRRLGILHLYFLDIGAQFLVQLILFSMFSVSVVIDNIVAECRTDLLKSVAFGLLGRMCQRPFSLGKDVW